jgi:hypothetical protein
MPRRAIFAADAGPTPWNFLTGRAWTNHPGIREDGDDIPPAGLGLGLDPVRHGAVGEYADLTGDIEEPGALGHLDRMTIGAERLGHRVRGVADVHASVPRLRDNRPDKTAGGRWAEYGQAAS